MQPTTRQIIAGRYALQEQIQSGGMTSVYRARDLNSDELVAIKRFDRDRHLPEIEREAFRREVDALQRLAHPNIVRMLDAGEDDEGRFFLALELMKHDLVVERDQRGAAFKGWDDFVELVALPLLQALTYAHEVGIAHRDVKPANVLVATCGTVKLADFGISKLKRTLQPRLTLSEFMSPPFAPPEADTGDQTYARDVYSVAMVCLWAMTDQCLRDHSDIASAFERFDVPTQEVEHLIRKATLPDPAARFQSAAVLAAEIERIQAKRRQVWARAERVSCAIGLTNKALSIAKEELGTEDEREIAQFITEDINLDSCIERFVAQPGTMNERVVPGHYIVLGSTFRYHIAESDRGFNSFALINAIKPDPDFLQRDRESAPPSPVRFEPEARTGTVPVSQAIRLIERTLDAYEEARRDQDRSRKETELFDLWSRVLSARVQYERDRSLPIRFAKSSVDGTFVTLSVSQDLNGIELGELRVIETDDGRRIRGEVWDLPAGAVVLNCPLANLADLPSTGIAKLDLYALQVAVDRQQDAVNRIRNGTNVAPRLRDLLLNPHATGHPEPITSELDADIVDLLDESKQRALRTALGSRDILLIQGPPGTGKTQFIVALILAELHRNPCARILLSSQTHIAIDNALERLGRYLPEGRILRIARESSTRVQDSAERFLVDRQMKHWRAEVAHNAQRGLEAWAAEQGLNPLDIQTGALLRQISLLRQRVDAARDDIHAEEERKRGLPDMKSMLPASEWQLEFDAVTDLLQDLRDKLDADKKKLALLEDRLRRMRKDGAELLRMAADEQADWAHLLLGDAPGEKTAERLISLQGEWLDRFGTSHGFMRPLIERSSVVASTCVGLAAVAEWDEVEFDLCIIDEASKATATEACIPMARSKRWVLVGDSRQLSPFQEDVLAHADLREHFDIQSDEASESLFERLRRLLPANCQTGLTIQYRMTQPIGRLISECFYSGELTSTRTSLDPVLSSVTGHAVTWISTRRIPRRQEQKAGTSYINAEEASLIVELLFELDDAAARAVEPGTRSVLVLSAYGAQVDYLERRIRAIRAQLRHVAVECCTVDRVQGRESDAVLFSVTRSNPELTAGFLRALERINVALSRARDLLLIVGDDGFVDRARNADPLQRVLRHIRAWPAECAMIDGDEYLHSGSK